MVKFDLNYHLAINLVVFNSLTMAILTWVKYIDYEFCIAPINLTGGVLQYKRYLLLRTSGK